MYKTILVSGANGNLGQAVTAYFLSAGWQVVGLVHKLSENPLQHPNYAAYEVDLLNESATEKIVEQLIKKYGIIHAAVLTAGGFKTGNLANTSSSDLLHQYRLNFETAYHLARPLRLAMEKEKTGSLFFIGSVPGVDTSKGTSIVAYSLAKSLLVAFCNMLNAEQKETGVSAYVVVPETIDTPQNRAAKPNADYSHWQKPHDIAKIIDRQLKSTFDASSVILTVSEELKQL